MSVVRATGGILAHVGGIAGVIVICQLPAWAETGYLTYYTKASCQAEGTSGTRTASGQPFDESAFTIALPHHHFGGWYTIRSLKTGKTVWAKHTDYGPSKHCQQCGVIADATPALFIALGHSLTEGRVEVEVTPVD